MIDRGARTISAGGEAPLEENEDAAPPPASEGLIRIGRFLILGVLGQGGMGQVLSAYDPQLDRKVAIKFVRDLADSPAAIARIKLEAQAMAKVSHPNVVQVYETGEIDGRVFIVMEFVDGATLGEWQERGDHAAAGEMKKRLGMYLQAAAGLLAAHAGGLIHRDFKPDNVLVGKDGRVRIADFGVARLLQTLEEHPPLSFPSGEGSESGARLTHAGAVMGTPGYMSPEQAAGSEADERSDQFCFCAALYEALYGQRPFDGKKWKDYAEHVRSDPPRPPPPSSVPLVVEKAILRGLSVDPGARFPSMKELMTALEAGLAPESEPLMTRADRIGLGLGLIVAIVVLELTNVLLVVLTGSRNSMLRPVVMVGLFFVVTSVMMRWPPSAVRHRARYRRTMAFFLILLATLFGARLAGYLLGIAADDYYTIECLIAAGLSGVEALRVGWRQAILSGLLVAYAPFIKLLPDLRVILYNLVLLVTVIGSILVHMRQAIPEDEAPAA
jgi:predicted Ser/Thr protein kinase